MLKPHDHPFHEAAAGAERVVAQGGTVYQKWWCVGCGARCRANAANTFTYLCVCEDCGAITDAKKNGCNYTAIISV